jgi:hypothetical protein
MKLLKMLSKPAAWASGWSRRSALLQCRYRILVSRGAWKSDMLGCARGG